jgi:hypothetical protein
MTITVKYGIDTHVLNVINQPTVADLQSNTTLKAVLGFGDNTRALIGGVEQPGHTLVPENATVVMETRANAKAN